jgi:hypothetical protein
VRLDLRPFQGRLRSDGSIAYSGAETTLVVAPGETAVVGGIASQDAARSRSALGGTSQGSSRSEELLLVTVRLDDEPPGAAAGTPPAGPGAR